MAYIELASGTWGTSPKIPYTFYYSKSRSGKDMIYKIKVVIGAIGSASSFGYPIKVSVNCGGKAASSQIKNASPSQWSSPITYETSNLTVANKTSGTTALSITLTGVEAPRGSTTYTYNLPIDPAMSSVSATSADIGSASTITISKSNTSFKHTLEYSYDGKNFTTIVTKTADDTVNWTIPEVTYDYVGASSKSKTITIKCITYSGDTEIGSKTTTLSATTVEAVCKPEVTLTIEHNTAIPELTGSEDIIINNNGEIIITGTSAAKKGASISKSTITVGSDIYNVETQTLNKLSSGMITFTATDSREYSSSVTENRTVVNYVKPTIIIEMPTISTDGVATFDIKGSWFNNTFGVEHNSLTIQYSCCKIDEEFEEWHDAEATFDTNDTKIYSAHIAADGLDYSKRYKFIARVIDSINTVLSEEIAAQAIPVFDWGAEDFNFNVPVSFSAGLANITQLGIADYIVEQNMSSVTETSYTCYKRYRVWNSGLIENWMIIEYNTEVPITTAWGSIFRSSYKGGFTWGKPFTNTEDLCITGSAHDASSGNATWVAPYGAKSTTILPNFYICRSVSAETAIPQISWYACGT